MYISLLIICLFLDTEKEYPTDTMVGALIEDANAIFIRSFWILFPSGILLFLYKRLRQEKA